MGRRIRFPASTALRASVFLAAAVLAACATSRFDEHFEAGRYVDAVREFDADPGLQDRERALYRAGLARSMAGSAAFDPALARAHFDRLLRLYPDSRYRPGAETAMALLGEVERLVARAARDAAARERLERQVTELDEQLADLRRQLDALKAIDLQETPVEVPPEEPE